MIQKEFAKIVGKEIGTIVVTVGDRDDSKIWQEYIDKFKPRGIHKFSPKKVSFTEKEGQKLKSANVKWTYNSSDVEKEVVKLLQKRKLFVFYRNGSFSGINEDPKEALDVVFYEILWDHHFLVVGDDGGLEEELENDIQIVADLAGLSNKDLHDLHKKMNNGFGRFYGREAVFTLLVIPNKSNLKTQLKECVLKCPNISLTIYYSGHGEQDFGWVLAGDDRFSGSDLRQVLLDIKPQHYPKITIKLNCCYGFAFVKEISSSLLLDSCLYVVLPDTIKQKFSSIDDIKEHLSVLPEDVNKHDEWFEDNKLVTEALCYIAYKTNNRVSQIKDLPYQISVVPFAVGPLEAKGILLQKIKKKDTNIDWSKVRAPLKKLQSYSEAIDPQLFVFGAGNGDSTLFCWFDFNMLVDGGLYTDPPCFWRTVHQLPRSQKLDVVVVTHYDDDHICGILRLFKEDPLPIEIGELYTTEPPKTPTTRSAKQGKLLWDLARKHKVEQKNLVCDPKMPIVDKKFGRCRLRIFMLTPKKNNLEKAIKEMRASRLTIPNKASASLLIECRIKKDTFKYALLTGDAPGEDIIKGLEQLVQNDAQVRNHCYQPVDDQHDYYCFDYIDMPHHGSKNNDPKYFLSKIKSKICVVSTNSRIFYRKDRTFSHPDVETVHELDEAMRDKIENLLFTYRNQRPQKIGVRTISDEFSDENKKNLLFTDNNPANKDCKQCLLVKLATPTPAYRKWVIA